MLFTNACYLAWTDTRARYKKSILGPLWLTLGNMVGVLGLSVVWGVLLKEDMRTFVPSLTIGMITWQLIAGVIGEGATTFINQSSMIRNVAIPVWFFVVRSLSRHIINLVHNFIIIIGVVIFFHFPIQQGIWLALIGLILVILNLFWIMYLLGMLGARFRDIEYLINAFLPLLFFISPVIFRPDRLPINMQIIWLNPLSYFIEVVRAPFLGTHTPPHTYTVMLATLIIGSSVTYLFYKLRGRRISFWV